MAQAQMWTDFYVHPGRFLEPNHLGALASDLEGLLARAGLGERAAGEILNDRVVALARDTCGSVRGCASAVPRTETGVGTVLDFAPAIVERELACTALVDRLEYDLIKTFLLRQRPLGRVWYTHGDASDAIESASILTVAGVALKRACRVKLMLPDVFSGLSWESGDALPRE